MATMHTQPQLHAVSAIGTAQPASEQQDGAQAEDAQPEVAPSRARRWLERQAERVGRSKLNLLGEKRKAVSAELRRIPDRMQKITNQARLVLELSDDFRAGTYRSISWLSIAVGAACLVYAVSPTDVVPDVIPALGALDDMVVITLAMHFLERDLRAYCRFKGYPESQYF